MATSTTESAAPSAQVFRYEKPEIPEGRGKTGVLLGRTDIAYLVVQHLRPDGGEKTLHSHAHTDGYWTVLSGRVRFYTTGDELIADLGPMEGVVIPRNYPYWFEAAGVESELLQFEANDQRQNPDAPHDSGRVDHTPRRS